MSTIGVILLLATVGVVPLAGSVVALFFLAKKQNVGYALIVPGVWWLLALGAAVFSLSATAKRLALILLVVFVGTALLLSMLALILRLCRKKDDGKELKRMNIQDL